MSSGFELNKIAGAVLLAGLIAMVTGTIADKLYAPTLHPKKRGFEVAVEKTEGASATGQKAEEKIDIATLLSTADVEAGKTISKKCQTCHSLDKGGPNKVGPDLWGVVGRPKGAHEGFSYSDAMKGKGGNWDYDSIFHFVTMPKSFVPGTKMAFAGIKKPQDTANLIAYLRTLSDSPVPLPTPSAPAAEPAASTPEDKAAATPAVEQPAAETEKKDEKQQGL